MEYKQQTFVTILFMIAIGIVSFIGGISMCASASMKQAVLHHAAHWDVKPDGTKTFKWNDER